MGYRRGAVVTSGLIGRIVRFLALRGMEHLRFLSRHVWEECIIAQTGQDRIRV